MKVEYSSKDSSEKLVCDFRDADPNKHSSNRADYRSKTAASYRKKK